MSDAFEWECLMKSSLEQTEKCCRIPDLAVLRRVATWLLMVSSVTLAAQSGDAVTRRMDQPAYEVIAPAQTAKLKAIRDAYGSIPNLDALYEDRMHTNGLPYHLYVPDGLEAGKPYPLVTFLHGYSDLTLDTHRGFPKGVWSLPRVQAKHPHILFVPRYRTFDDMWVQDGYRAMVIEVLDDLVREFNGDPKLPSIDASRLYLTGFSQGGMGTWNYVRHYPHKFAAAAPLSGFSHGPATVSQAQAIGHIPIWIFNGDGDRGVGGSRLSFQVLQQAQAPDVRYHEYPQQGHVIDDFAYFTEGFMDWFFSQRCPRRMVRVAGQDVLDILDALGARREEGATDQQLVAYAAHFNRVDTDQDGEHSRKEYVDEGRYMTPQARSGIFRAADNNDDDVVTRVEYVLNRLITDEAKTLVQKTDANGDGKIVKSEFVAGSPLEDRQLAAAVFDCFDANGDGTITIPEYLRVWGIWSRPNYQAQEAALAARMATLGIGKP